MSNGSNARCAKEGAVAVAYVSMSKFYPTKHVASCGERNLTDNYQSLHDNQARIQLLRVKSL
jgi:hypothetical protein